ncbi:DUF4402 domain-containing protein [Deinococcus hopiensis]|uniref:Fimbrial protein n=1 Tax=Deinococcus hopiensis KR-140 TaxID=695939 RepID=A0A1W1UDU3_9DEIO|nr:DUF4402 domain-containing protein [Deinococcus hopiensis]SMB79247.1 protein of unknown function [Deinococcus hopiensis KR-140]
MKKVQFALLSAFVFASPLASAGTATFDPSTSAALGTSESFLVKATIGHACVLSKPADIDLGTLYWTGTSSSTKSTTFTVQCNVGTSGVPTLSVTPSTTLALTRSGGAEQVTVNVAPSNLTIDNTSSAAQSFSIGATLPASQVTVDKPAGTYTGTVTVAVNFTP